MGGYRVSGQYSRRLVVGFVCEGSTDIVVLRRIVEQVVGPIDARTLQPQTDELDRTVPGSPAGWSEVRAWCERLRDYNELFEPPVGDPFDLIIIGVDLDIAVRAGIYKMPENLKAYDATALCEVVKSWLATPVPFKLIIVIPAMAIEAWILAAMFPKRPRPEMELKPAQVLVQRGKMEQGANGPWRQARRYSGFANIVAAKLKAVRSACPEADRFVAKLERFEHQRVGDPRPGG